MSLADLVTAGEPQATAIGAPDAAPLTYAGLAAQIEATGAALAGEGIGRGDRVATALTNGPAAATVFLSICAWATAAPLNPAYTEDEFAFSLADFRARALILEKGVESPAARAAGKLGMPILVLEPRPDLGAGRFSLQGEATGKGRAPERAEATDTALVLHTSGTTAKPKIVPLSHGNLAASARNVGAALRLSPADAGLVLMPLFHIHGLVAGVLAPLAAGGRIFCPPPFNALRVFAWIEEARPSWWTAVPTMHQAILARAARNPEIIAANPLRFLRSSSASMPPSVLADLEAMFACPLVEAYGMTEAAHQMTSNPLPPARRIPGSVGLAAGPEVAVLDGAGDFLAPGEPGEVAIRGPNVTAGYEANPAANAAAFTGDWFRTGDEGVLDGEGYLTLTGRLKELINRGGEKIAPREVDEALLTHPSVLQAVAFALPHEKLGEEVAAAVVLREGAEGDERGLRAHLAERLAPFKVPRRIVFVGDIPKGPSGKLQRIGLAAKLGLAES